MKPTNQFIIIDDDYLNNLICKHIILKFDKDAQITLFTDPQEALVFIAERFGDSTERGDTVIFLDINMPVLNGWEFLSEFEMFDGKIQNQIAIYILSSSIDQDDMQKADRNRFVSGFYSKPLSLETMNLISGRNNRVLH